MKKFALDTSIIIEYLNEDETAMAGFRNTVESNRFIVIPTFANYEVMRGFYHKPNAEKEAVYKNMRLFCPVVDVDEDIWDCAAQVWAKLRKTGRTVGDADILIAAICITNGYALVTRNTKHFEGIDGLEIEDWFNR